MAHLGVDAGHRFFGCCLLGFKSLRRLIRCIQQLQLRIRQMLGWLVTVFCRCCISYDTYCQCCYTCEYQPYRRGVHHKIQSLLGSRLGICGDCCRRGRRRESHHCSCHTRHRAANGRPICAHPIPEISQSRDKSVPEPLRGAFNRLFHVLQNLRSQFLKVRYRRLHCLSHLCQGLGNPFVGLIGLYQVLIGLQVVFSGLQVQIAECIRNQLLPLLGCGAVIQCDLEFLLCCGGLRHLLVVLLDFLILGLSGLVLLLLGIGQLLQLFLRKFGKFDVLFHLYAECLTGIRCPVYGVRQAAGELSGSYRLVCGLSQSFRWKRCPELSVSAC